MLSSTPSAALPFLSPRAKRVLEIDVSTAYTALVPQKTGAIEAHDLLETLKPADVFLAAPSSVNDAACALSGLWLWHDFLDASHTISQAIETPTGSFWHGIMHRREGDFSNAKYWYRRVGSHPAFAPLAQRVALLTHELPSDKRIFKVAANGWDANAFVDLVEDIHQKPGDPRLQTIILMQKLEWQTLFETTAGRAK